MTNKTIREKQIELQEKEGYTVKEEFTGVTVMKNEKSEFIKVDEDGMVVPFKPLNEGKYE